MPGTTPIYGFPYPEPTDLVADYPALGQQLAEDIEDVLPTIGGLAPATPTSIANSGGTASLSGNTVTFTGVTSVSLNGCFTADYDNYRVLIRTTATSTTNQLGARFRLSGTDATTAYSYVEIYADIGGTPAALSGSNVGFFNATYMSNTTDSSVKALDILRPFVAQQTVVTGTGLSTTAASTISARHATATAYDGMTIYTSTGAFSGTVSVYAYKK